MAYEFDLQSGLISAIITILVASILVHFAAKMVIDRSSFLTAIVVVVLATLLASLVAGLLDGMLGLVLGLVVWALIAAIFYRTRWVKGAIIGLVAWVLWFLVNLLLNKLLG